MLWNPQKGNDLIQPQGGHASMTQQNAPPQFTPSGTTALCPCPCGRLGLWYFTLLFPLVRRDGTVKVMAANDLVDDLCEKCFERLGEEERVGWRRIDAREQ